ncbi:Auxilin-related protein 2 [Heracleum sosnowskyi]|uniref:Auxilin-related protein 2 n=1 Tax=Heracleum sosnowskyi TaxID=360622 RepID=A0AAD8H887_9APIA|nr:Auxilin-related protein 2 [Heracleum sosnowskyi]
MDQFGVLVESIGFKAQSKSTPLADLKGKNNGNNGFSPNLDFKAKSPSNSVDGSGFGDFFGSNNGLKTQNSNGFDDVFGGSNVYDLDSVFKGSNNVGAKSGLFDDSDDIFGGFSGEKDSGSTNYENVFRKIPPPPKRNDFNDDLLGGFTDMGLKSDTGSGFDDLIPGFGGISDARNGEKSERGSSWHSSDQDGKSKINLVEDPFNIFETSTLQRNNAPNLVPDLLNQGGNRASEDVDVLESMFGMSTRSKSVPSPNSVTKDSVYDALFQKSKVPANQGLRNPPTTRKVSPVINVDDDFSFLSEVEVAPPSVKFQEVEGESEERRRARLNHYQNTQERMIKALNEKNQRDRQVQLEQEERHRLSATLDDDIKRWALGKEGNLRALLSSLQYVLWPECGWRPVSLTDMMTSISVKKVYQKATLCVHPDKVQQKGANIQQKYIAEKVFDILKEAYNKFSSEEL